MLTQISNNISDLPVLKVVSSDSIELYVLTLTVQGIFHFLCDCQYLCISMEALVVPITSVAGFSIRVSFNCFVEEIYRIFSNLQLFC